MPKNVARALSRTQLGSLSVRLMEIFIAAQGPWDGAEPLLQKSGLGANNDNGDFKFCLDLSFKL